jgi:hypothetical protein
MCPDVHESPRFAVPDNVVKQVFEGRTMMLALLCGGLRMHYAPVAEGLPSSIVEGLRTHRRVSDGGGNLVSTDRWRRWQRA